MRATAGRATDGTTRRFTFAFALLCMAVLGGGSATAARADGGVAAAKNLSQTRGLIDNVTTKAVGPGGTYGTQPHASDVPFIGADPTASAPTVFDALKAPLEKFDELKTVAENAPASVVAAKVADVNTALGSVGQLSVLCDGVACAAQPLSSVSTIRVHVSLGGQKNGSVAFGLGGLKALNLKTDDAPKLATTLTWKVNVDLVANQSGLSIHNGTGPARRCRSSGCSTRSSCRRPTMRATTRSTATTTTTCCSARTASTPSTAAPATTSSTAGLISTSSTATVAGSTSWSSGPTCRC